MSRKPRKMYLRPELWLLAAVVLVGGVAAVEYGAKEFKKSGPRAEAKTASEDRAPRVGQEAPDFTLPGMDGRQRRLYDFIGTRTVLTFLCGCARCQGMVHTLNEMEEYRDDKPPYQHLAVARMDPEALPRWIEDTGYEGFVFVEVKDGPVMTRYQGEPCPRIFVLDPDFAIVHVTPSPEEGIVEPQEVLIPLSEALGSRWQPMAPLRRPLPQAN
jgi:peroxiredoxin